MTIIDNFTHFMMANLLKSKADAFEFFKFYETMSMCHFGHVVKRVCCNSGGEYTSKWFKSFCPKKGMQIEYTIRCIPA